MTLRTALVIDGDARGARAATDQAAAGLKKFDDATDAATAATRANTAAQTVNNRVMRQATAQRANLIYQLNDIFVSLASGQNPAMVAIQQGSQISTIYGPGGLGKALKETGNIAVQAATKFGPLLVITAAIAGGLVGLQHEINRTRRGIDVSFGDTALAVLQTFADYIWNTIGPAVRSIGDWFADEVWPRVTSATAGTINVMVRGWMGFLAELELIAGGIEHIFELTWQNVVDGLVDLLQQVTDFVLTDINILLQKLGQTPIEINFDGWKSGGDDEGWSKALLERFNARLAAINGTDYAAKFFNDVADHAQANALAGEKDKKGKQSDFAREIAQIRERTAAIANETAVLGLSTFEAEKARNVLELETAAKKDAIGLSAERIKTIEAEATAHARAVAQLELMRDVYDTGKQALNGFFNDLLSGAREGMSVLETFGNAAVNVLDRLAQKALGMAADGIWDMIFGAVFGGVTGGLTPKPVTGIGFGSYGSYDVGGWTGGRRGRLAGVVHGEEFVVRAGPAAANRGLLEAMNAGQSVGGGSFTFSPVNQFSLSGGQADIPAFERLLDQRDAALADQFQNMIADYLANPSRRTR